MRARTILTYVLALTSFVLGCDPDDFVAPWPQSNVEPRDYDESGLAGPLRAKADSYDDWHVAWHQPDHGGTVTQRFTDTDYTALDAITYKADSTIWTGVYLASQAMRHHVSGDPEARANALRMTATLSGTLHVTGVTGYVARYWAPQTSTAYFGDEWCDTQVRCHHLESGPYAGDFWWGETSRDQYIGWLFGLVTAYDLLDDEPTREAIRADVLEVFHALLDHGWVIVDERGLPSAVAPQILISTQLYVSLIAYHVSGDERALGELRRLITDGLRTSYVLNDLNAWNRYNSYFANNLSHITWYTILRLGKVYLGAADHDWMRQHFDVDLHTYTRLSHNPWFNAMYMSQGPWTPAPSDDPYLAQLDLDLTDFPAPPNRWRHTPAREPGSYTVDPFSRDLVALWAQFPWLADLLGLVHLQALEALPVMQQCLNGFQWQHDPFVVEECGADDPTQVEPGVDYLSAYWLASYHKLLDRGE
ncbi:MAG: hypothetical protein IPK07_26085 [Deltaproteobacteria bacterium]|jgi:hypothetical protein|nr:hypothetical protein [Deltaproteobacteria bacterium]